jgi:hypothetical protein
MKKLWLALAFVAVFFLGWGAHAWKGHHGMCGRHGGDHAAMCGHHGGQGGPHGHGGHGDMACCGKSDMSCCKKMGDKDCCAKDSTGAVKGKVGCCGKMDALDCCEKTNCEGHSKLDSTNISVGGQPRGECCKKGGCDKRG